MLASGDNYFLIIYSQENCKSYSQRDRDFRFEMVPVLYLGFVNFHDVFVYSSVYPPGGNTDRVYINRIMLIQLRNLIVHRLSRG